MSISELVKGVDLRRFASARTHPFRVAYIIDRLSRAGTEMQLLGLIRGLDRSCVMPSLILLDGEDEDSLRLAPPDCPVLRLGVRSLTSGKAVRAAWQLTHWLRHHRIHILQTYFIDSTLFGVPVARWAGVQRIIRVRNNLGYWLTRRHRWWSRRVEPWIDMTLTNSAAGRDALMAEGVPARKIAVIENGIDVERFVADPPRFACPLRFGAVANLRPVKGLDLLVRAAARLAPKYPHLIFEVAGEGPQRPELELLIRDLGLEARFILRGSVANVPEFLAGLDVFIQPSRSESLSNALLEAMASGRAIVATRVGAAQQLIRDGIDGLLVDPENVAELVHAMEFLLQHPDVARRMGEESRKRVAESYSRQAMCRRFEQFYRDFGQREAEQADRSLVNSTGRSCCEPDSTT